MSSPSALRIVALLLIAQSITRLGLLGYSLTLARPEVLLANPFFFARGFLLPAVLAGLAMGAGILLLQQSPIARTFGLVACSICLLVQIYFTAIGVGVYVSVPTMPLLTVFTILVLGPIYGWHLCGGPGLFVPLAAGCNLKRGRPKMGAIGSAAPMVKRVLTSPHLW
jgi:hypothetical protein